MYTAAINHINLGPYFTAAHPIHEIYVRKNGNYVKARRIYTKQSQADIGTEGNYQRLEVESTQNEMLYKIYYTSQSAGRAYGYQLRLTGLSHIHRCIVDKNGTVVVMGQYIGDEEDLPQSKAYWSYWTGEYDDGIVYVDTDEYTDALGDQEALAAIELKATTMVYDNRTYPIFYRVGSLEIKTGYTREVGYGTQYYTGSFGDPGKQYSTIPDTLKDYLREHWFGLIVTPGRETPGWEQNVGPIYFVR